MRDELSKKGKCTVTTQFEKELAALMGKVARYHPTDSQALVEKAFTFAEKAHEGQMRETGDPYFIHPVSVALTLADLQLDAATIAAGLLHDTVEDCEGVTLEVIEREFGQEVATMVDGVTKLEKIDFSSREERHVQGCARGAHQARGPAA